MTIVHFIIVLTKEQLLIMHLQLILALNKALENFLYLDGLVDFSPLYTEICLISFGKNISLQEHV